MSKILAVTIPCFNEEKTIAKVIESIPRNIKEIKRIEIIVINDGSTDRTALIAADLRVKHILSHTRKLGLAKSFSDGIRKALDVGADIIVNIDGDGQYLSNEILLLIEPILRNEADFVLGNRRIETLSHMPVSKKAGNILGSFVVRQLTGSNIADASTGFRAHTREVVKSFNTTSDHTYTHETIIQACQCGFRIVNVPITFKKRASGDSKLITSIWSHILLSLSTILRTIMIYKAYKYFLTLGLLLLILGLFGVVRFLYFFLTGDGDGHIQSIIFSSILIGVGLSTFVMGIVSDLIAINRRLIQDVIVNQTEKDHNSSIKHT